MCPDEGMQAVSGCVLVKNWFEATLSLERALVDYAVLCRLRLQLAEHQYANNTRAGLAPVPRVPAVGGAAALSVSGREARSGVQIDMRDTGGTGEHCSDRRAAGQRGRGCEASLT